MTEDIFEKNLKIRTEVFLKDTVFSNISNSIFVLYRCETLLPVSEEVNLVSQLINAITNNAYKEQLTSGLSKLECNFPPKPVQCIDSETPSNWWGKSLAVLNLDFFQRVLLVVKTKGLKQDIINRILINYAQNSLQGLFIKDPQLIKRSFLDLDLQKRQGIIIETIAGLLPTQSRKSTVPMANTSVDNHSGLCSYFLQQMVDIACRLLDVRLASAVKVTWCQTILCFDPNSDALSNSSNSTLRIASSTYPMSTSPPVKGPVLLQ
ncbi:BTB/POZ domain-containing protein SETH6 [Capsicum chinense]|nr:BTB/POZ domain-containing protein SETH6 [Capsicum chinense]